ncbi:MAG: CARDB domain-containing protein, partial [Thermoplasmata archaeon]
KDTKAEVQCTVKNTGLIEASGASAKLYLNDTLRATSPIPTLSSNQSTTVKLSFTPDSVGLFRLIITLNVEGGIARNFTMPVEVLEPLPATGGIDPLMVVLILILVCAVAVIIYLVYRRRKASETAESSSHEENEEHSDVELVEEGGEAQGGSTGESTEVEITPVEDEGTYAVKEVVKENPAQEPAQEVEIVPAEDGAKEEAKAGGEKQEARKKAKKKK